jgi:hypothetical protein
MVASIHFRIFCLPALYLKNLEITYSKQLYLLRLYGITKENLELQNSKASRRAIAMKEVGKQTQLHNVWQDPIVNAEPAVATNIARK